MSLCLFIPKFVITDTTTSVRNRENIWNDIFGQWLPYESCFGKNIFFLFRFSSKKKYSIKNVLFPKNGKISAFHQTNNYRDILLGAHFFSTVAHPVPGLVTLFAAMRWWIDNERELKSPISWMTALKTGLFKRRQMISGTSNASGMWKWKYLCHQWMMFVLNLAQTTLKDCPLCGTGGEELPYYLVTDKDYNIVITKSQ